MIEITITGGMVYVLWALAVIYAVDMVVNFILYLEKRKLKKLQKLGER